MKNKEGESRKNTLLFESRLNSDHSLKVFNMRLGFHRIITAVVAGLLIITSTNISVANNKQTSGSRPNIVLIMCDEK